MAKVLDSSSCKPWLQNFDQYFLGARNVENVTAAIDELRKMDIQAKIEVIHLDVNSDSSIIAAEHIQANHGRLDCLIK